MSAVMLLGLVAADLPEPPDAPAHGRVAAGPWDALVLPVPDDLDCGTEAGTIALAQVQHRLLCGYAAQGDVLPVALGGAFTGAEAVLHHLRAEAARLQRLAEHLSGRVEYSVAISRVARPAEPLAAASGRAHLRQRARARDLRDAGNTARRAYLDALSDRIGHHAEARRLVPAGRPDRPARLDFLVRRDLLPTCLREIEATLPEATTLGLSLCLTGPYPAFSFAAGVMHDG